MSAIARVNNLELRLASDASEIHAAQRLRYNVFYEEMGAIPNEATIESQIDRDRFDDIADHLIVVDIEQTETALPAVVGCYRLLRNTVAKAHGGLYTSGEFDLSVLDSRSDEVVELGRSCVHPDFRNGTVMQLLWRGVAHYIDQFQIGIMLGCASLPGTDLEHLAPALSYLKTNFLAPPEFRPRALDRYYVDIGERLFDTCVAGKPCYRRCSRLISGWAA